MKIANAVLTLNEIASGRSILAISGGGGVLGACGWTIQQDADTWPFKSEKSDRDPERRECAVCECVDIIELAPELAYGDPTKHMMIREPSGNRIEFAHTPRGGNCRLIFAARESHSCRWAALSRAARVRLQTSV